MATGIRLSAIAVSVLALAMAIGILKAQSEQTGVIFTAEFPSPLLDPAVLAESAPAAFHVRLKITNDSGHPLRFSRYRSVLPELLDAGGTAAPFEFGANVSRVPRASDYPLLAPGQALVVPVDGTLVLRNGQIDWKGGDGTLGFWKVSPASAPYRVRLRYRQKQAAVGPFEGQSGPLSGLWVGEGVTSAVELPIKFTK